MADVSRLEDVSVVIVSYNTREALLRCLHSLDPRCEVIVVDNASSDRSAEAARSLPHVQVIENKENRGFGAANNQGMAIATRPLILLLNSDCVASPGAISELASVFEDAGVVAAGGMLLHPDCVMGPDWVTQRRKDQTGEHSVGAGEVATDDLGCLQESCANELTLWAVLCEQTWLEKLFKSSKTFSPYWMSHRLAGSEEPVPVAQVMGACLMMRPVEKFDERFFLYCEDTELCRRLSMHGRILYVPKARFLHELGASSKAMRWRAVAMYNCGKELYFRIHDGWFPGGICFVFDRFGALLRLVAWSCVTVASAGTNARARELTATFWRVLWAPSSYKKLRPPR